MEVAKKLKESRKYTLAEEILKLHKSKVKDDPEAAYQVNMEIMHILSLQVCIMFFFTFYNLFVSNICINFKFSTTLIIVLPFSYARSSFVNF